MKISEVINKINTYISTVRVVLPGSNTVTRTTITADSYAQAYALLSKLYGKENVGSICMFMHESAQTDQIQQEATISPPVVSRRAEPRKIAQIQSSQVQQQQKRPQRREVLARPIADPIKHELIQDRLTKQFIRQSNIVKPTSDDIRIARDRAEIALKKADLQFKKQSNAQLHKQKQKRKRNNQNLLVIN